MNKTSLLLRLFGMRMALELGHRERFLTIAARTLREFDADCAAFAHPAPMRDMLAALADVACSEPDSAALDLVEKTRQYCLTL